MKHCNIFSLIIRMIHKKKNPEKKSLLTIPALRRSFEHIEAFVDELISKKESEDKIVKLLQKEWQVIFLKPIPKKSAVEFVKQRVSHCIGTSHRTLRRKGGSTIFSGAPLDSSMGPGLFLAPNSPPNAQGHLTLSNGSPSSYGSFVDYITSGFKVPDMAIKSDPIQGQPLWPIPSMFGGKRGLKTKSKSKSGSKHRARSLKSRTRGGGPLDTTGTIISQVMMHPIPSSNPSTIMNDLQNSVFGVFPNPPSDQVQRVPTYQMGAVYPRPVSF
jgi:hypothetical protein